MANPCTIFTNFVYFCPLTINNTGFDNDWIWIDSQLFSKTFGVFVVWVYSKTEEDGVSFRA